MTAPKKKPAAKKTKRGVGRPTKWKDEYLPIVKNMALLGLNDLEMAQVLDVKEDTFYRWKREKSEFSEALKEGKEIADGKVVRALYERALGYVVTEDRIIRDEVVTLERQLPPDTPAATLWLKNRQPDKWRDKQEIDHTTDGEKIDVIERVIVQVPKRKEQEATPSDCS